jgi:gas vesicle protein
MRKETRALLTAFSVGAVVGGTAVLLLTSQSGRETRMQIRSGTEEPRAKLKKPRTWDEDELVRWDQEFAEIEQAAQEALEEARMG